MWVVSIVLRIVSRYNTSLASKSGYRNLKAEESHVRDKNRTIMGHACVSGHPLAAGRVAPVVSVLVIVSPHGNHAGLQAGALKLDAEIFGFFLSNRANECL